MKTWIPAWAILLCSLMRVGFAANMYTITVKVTGGTISYSHVMGTHGAHGHQIVKLNDTITWTCNSSCTLVAITFKGTSPCANPGTTCDVTYTGTDVFPYSVAVIDSITDNPIVHDPDVIVDNSGSRLPDGKREPPPNKQVPKKN